MSCARSRLSVTVLDGLLYAIGGRDGGIFLSSMERYDPSSDRWETMQPISIPRGNFGVAVLGDRLYAAGGVENGLTGLANMERYDPRTDSWEGVEPMSQRRGYLALVAL